MKLGFNAPFCLNLLDCDNCRSHKLRFHVWCYVYRAYYKWYVYDLMYDYDKTLNKM